jgi:hypothetical protein
MLQLKSQLFFFSFKNFTVPPTILVYQRKSFKLLLKCYSSPTSRITEAKETGNWFMHRQLYTEMSHRAAELTVVLRPRILTAVDQLNFQVRPCRGQSGIWASSSPGFSVFPCHYHYTNAVQGGHRQGILFPVVERFQ